MLVGFIPKETDVQMHCVRTHYLSLWQLCVIKIMHLKLSVSDPGTVLTVYCCSLQHSLQTVFSMSIFSLNISFYLAINVKH